MRLFRPIHALQFLYPEVIFRIKTDCRQLCLTFDDGPDPDSTPMILSILREHHVKAIFFCSGEQSEKFPDLVTALKNEGHIIGNHCFHHSDGWRTNLCDYINNVEKASSSTSEVLFRPPYGHLTLTQYRTLKKKYRIVFWDIMPYDFDKSFGPANCLRILKKKTRNGSVIVMHDKPGSLVFDILNDYINYANDLGFEFIIPDLFIPSKEKKLL
ncbi:MAG TPA: polysaccharide deacetylase family protein [Bacteroidales bacterium]|nr:polysaccharide deacetylase family protein [Bacteroidales bacterium]